MASLPNFESKNAQTKSVQEKKLRNSKRSNANWVKTHITLSSDHNIIVRFMLLPRID